MVVDVIFYFKNVNSSADFCWDYNIFHELGIYDDTEFTKEFIDNMWEAIFKTEVDELKSIKELHTKYGMSSNQIFATWDCMLSTDLYEFYTCSHYPIMIYYIHKSYLNGGGKVVIC